MDKTTKWAAFPVGTKVRCVDPDNFVSDTARKLRNRVGTVERHQMFSGAPIVNFPGVGRRKPWQWVPPDPREVEAVSDEGN